MSNSPILFSSDDEDEDGHLESEVLKKFNAMLQGVPPPSSVTMSKLSVDEMLTKYKENESTFGFGLLDATKQKCHRKANVTPLVYYLNSSQTSEDIAGLSQRIQSRYICSETMSSCNEWFDAAIKINSAKKRSGRRNGFGLSPGSRLSHLARRRQVFSCANLQQLANSERRRHIEIKKQDALKNRSLEVNQRVEVEKLNSSKRALFQSPDDEETKKANSLKRNLFPSSEKRKVPQDNGKTVNVGSSKKRKRLESKEGNGKWPRRALTFAEEDAQKAQEKNSRNEKLISEIQLSLHHKSKLLWAVSVSLKEKNMTSKDPQFKVCAAALFMICRKNLGKILSSKVEGGTSEKMLHFARKQVDGIFKKLDITRDIEISDNRVPSVSTQHENSIPEITPKTNTEVGSESLAGGVNDTLLAGANDSTITNTNGTVIVNANESFVVESSEITNGSVSSAAPLSNISHMEEVCPESNEKENISVFKDGNGGIEVESSV